jgi:Fe-S oxidoreductase
MSQLNIPVMADLFAQGEKPEYLFWVGCAGAFDKRYQKVTRAFAKILNHLKISYAVLGSEESCTGDPAKRAGNEMLFQMQAFQNIETFKMYELKKIITICPHCFNIFKNEYTELGVEIEVIHHTEFINNQIENGKLKIDSEIFANNKITFHDPCYLGRNNGIYEAPRQILNKIKSEKIEMPRNKENALCCGAGGAQMFKEAEKGNQEIFMERSREALETKADIIATACPFCMTMLSDGIKMHEKNETVKNLDIAELIAQSLNL